jgi:Na+-transporting NADH:ubiquinone oxidoreductase subunit B
MRKFLDKIKPNFEEGKKLHFLQSSFDAVETLLFVPNITTKKGSHVRDGIDLKRLLIVVVIATVPSLLFGMFNVGIQHYLSQTEFIGNDWKSIIPIVGFWQIFFYGFLKILPIIIVSYVVGITVEVIFAQIRKHEVSEGVFVTCMLVPLIVPPDIPIWMLVVSLTFALIFGKEVFGGTGMNIVNPALLTRAFLFFAFPAFMSGDKVWITQSQDAISGATPLSFAASGDVSSMPSIMDMLLGFVPGSVGETSFIAIALGMLIMIFTGVISMRILLSVFAGGYLMALVFNLWGANELMLIPAHVHLIMGGFAFGAVFMATDPVTASQTASGKLFYGFLIGMLGIMIRIFNPAYPEGMMLAILFMNIMAPLIDHVVVGRNIKRRLKRLKIKTN